jgi:hypothetical protein
LLPGQAVIVPRDRWHRLELDEPSDLLVVTARAAPSTSRPPDPVHPDNWRPDRPTNAAPAGEIHSSTGRPRERQVLAPMPEGRSDPAIARSLDITNEATAKHVGNTLGCMTSAHASALDLYTDSGALTMAPTPQPRRRRNPRRRAVRDLRLHDQRRPDR